MVYKADLEFQIRDLLVLIRNYFCKYQESFAVPPWQWGFDKRNTVVLGITCSELFQLFGQSTRTQMLSLAILDNAAPTGCQLEDSPDLLLVANVNVFFQLLVWCDVNVAYSATLLQFLQTICHNLPHNYFALATGNREAEKPWSSTLPFLAIGCCVCTHGWALNRIKWIILYIQYVLHMLLKPSTTLKINTLTFHLPLLTY